LSIERLPVLNTTSEELRPIRHFGNRVGPLRQEPPERRVMPTKLVLGTIAMLADAVPQLLNFLDKLLARHLFEIIVHISQIINLKSQISNLLTKADFVMVER
jgi:hypothetical protein